MLNVTLREPQGDFGRGQFHPADRIDDARRCCVAGGTHLEELQFLCETFEPPFADREKLDVG
jgi:hypothetical protein